MDAKEFLKNKLSGLPLFMPGIINRIFAHRALFFRGWREGFFNKGEMIKNFLPGRFRPADLNGKQNQYVSDILNKIFLENNLYREKTINLFGHPFIPANEKSSLDSWRIFFLLFSQVIEQDQYHLKDIKKEDMVIIDVGANIGLFSVAAATWRPQSLVYAFEPSASTFQILKKNSSFYPNIKPILSGLGDKIAEVDLYIGKTSDSNYVLEGAANINKENIEKIKIDTIDNFVKENNLKKVDFIKIDTEGYEEKVIKGAVQTIKNFSPVIAMSAYHKKDDKIVLPRLVKSINPSYKCKLYKESEEVFIFTVK